MQSAGYGTNLVRWARGVPERGGVGCGGGGKRPRFPDVHEVMTGDWRSELRVAGCVCVCLSTCAWCVCVCVCVWVRVLCLSTCVRSEPSRIRKAALYCFDLHLSEDWRELRNSMLRCYTKKLIRLVETSGGWRPQHSASTARAQRQGRRRPWMMDGAVQGRRGAHPAHAAPLPASSTPFQAFLTIITPRRRKIKSIMTDYHSKVLQLIGAGGFVRVRRRLEIKAPVICASGPGASL